MRFRVDIDDGAAVAALKKLRDRGENLEPALRSVGELLQPPAASAIRPFAVHRGTGVCESCDLFMHPVFFPALGANAISNRRRKAHESFLC